MRSFSSLYNRLLLAGIDKKLEEEIEKLDTALDYDEHHLDCLLNPKKQPAVIKLSDCSCNEKEKEECKACCEFDAISYDGKGDIEISYDKCVGCGECIDHCVKNNLAEVKEFIPVIRAINAKKTPVYAMIAPAYIGQFSKEVTPGKLRSAFKKLGFSGLLEVALFADILTLKEEIGRASCRERV